MSISGLLPQPTKPSTVTTISFASAGSVSYSQYHIIFPFKSYSLLQVYIDTGLFIALYDLRGRRAPAGALSTPLITSDPTFPIRFLAHRLSSRHP